VDYEIFGDGSGCVDACVIQPAERLLAMAERHAVRLTLFVEALEFRTMERAGGRAAETADRVRAQLVDAVHRGHDLQLHIHPQWLGAEIEPDSGWRLDLRRWRLGSLERHDAEAALTTGLEWLSAVREAAELHPAPIAFRAGGWCIQPSSIAAELLVEHGLRVESSVAPGLGKPSGGWYDFGVAPTTLGAWPVTEDVCAPASAGRLLEVPIATGRLGWPRRLVEEASRRAARDGSLAPGCRGSYAGPGGAVGVLRGKLARLRSAGTAMLDVCAFSGPVLVELARQWADRRSVPGAPVPVVAIGHTKNFSRRAEKATEFLLSRLAGDPGFAFSTYGGWLRSRSGDARP